MSIRSFTPAIGFGVSLLALTGSDGVCQSLPRVLIQTEVGDIEIVVDTIRAPVTGTNFLRYVDERFYDGGRFFRTVTMDNQPTDDIRIQVIQAVADSNRRSESYPAIPLESTSTTGLHHRDGSISMARASPNSATSSFFICIGDQPALNYGGQRNPDGQGFAAFGRVVTGMDIVRHIHASPAEGQTLAPAIRVLNARRLHADTRKLR